MFKDDVIQRQGEVLKNLPNANVPGDKITVKRTLLRLGAGTSCVPDQVKEES